MIAVGTFLIHTINNQVKHDFSFALIESIDYQNWLHKGSHDYQLIETNEIFERDYSKYIPVGTIQFIEKFLATYYDIHKIKPINIPSQLMQDEYLKRKYSVCSREDIVLSGKKFVKSQSVIKGFTEIINKTSSIPEGKYIVSDIIDIESEWRAFVFNKRLVGLKNYSGDFANFPNVQLISRMIVDYKDSPPAYTIDVGVNRIDGTFLIEVHNFYSCGLYGFNNCSILPQMFIQSFRHLVKNKY